MRDPVAQGWVQKVTDDLDEAVGWMVAARRERRQPPVGGLHTATWSTSSSTSTAQGGDGGAAVPTRPPATCPTTAATLRPGSLRAGLRDAARRPRGLPAPGRREPRTVTFEVLVGCGPLHATLGLRQLLWKAVFDARRGRGRGDSTRNGRTPPRLRSRPSYVERHHGPRCFDFGYGPFAGSVCPGRRRTCVRPTAPRWSASTRTGEARTATTGMDP